MLVFDFPVIQSLMMIPILCNDHYSSLTMIIDPLLTIACGKLKDLQMCTLPLYPLWHGSRFVPCILALLSGGFLIQIYSVCATWRPF